MRVDWRGRALAAPRKRKSEYPLPSIVFAVVLLYLAPFISPLLAIPATMICAYRVLRYDARIYAADYCIVAPIIALSRVFVGVPLLLYLSLFAAVWYFFRRGFRAEQSYLILVVLMNYLMLRMQMDINAFVLYFGQLFTLCVLVPEQDSESAERAVKAFCLNLLISSIYAWVFRNHYSVRVISGEESLAIWGTNIKRFKGLFEDPNFYMTLLTVAVALLLKLKDSGRIEKGHYIVLMLSMTVFGILTYSKTFFLMFVLLIGIYLVWQFWNRKVLRGLFLTVLAIIMLTVVFTMDNSPFAVVLTRIRGAKNISDFTTNRSDIYLEYWRNITSDYYTFFFGRGLAADRLNRDPHNLYLEITYYTGMTGFLLFAGFHMAMFRTAYKRVRNAPKQNLIAKYEVPLIVIALYFTLHGMFQPVLYANLFLSYLSVLLIKKGKQGLLQ